MGEIGYLTSNENEAVTFTYSAHNGLTYQALISLVYLNIEYRLVWAYCAGATTVFIKDKTSSGTIGQTWQYAGEKPWINNAGTPDTYVKVYGKDGKAEDTWNINGFRAYVEYAPRKSGRDVESRHILRFRNSPNGAPYEIMNFLWR